ncbi:uncharacterized protein SPPG_06924 [Spizellomyces punctatus DAOM BR117]|uniref:Uncharacterized protein n=1 Tax=Spizellomyces punctatus (strain DAOM BR117) TaxID=645134 RepID=A0A0L0HA91_SPIPD|nr:uncharacterized protein SPPG_06924 [Spizellomyces punctatus DAOM BR117]KNC97936.1 hypothetical protein SPPG_06924 [Spizellomyces punctatus DAOM BR117]|eukprot:XP_016605976.1 hypothetical protein SPPG_06924 [Spizellomyces punctatus DAOM BR117]
MPTFLACPYQPIVIEDLYAGQRISGLDHAPTWRMNLTAASVRDSDVFFVAVNQQINVYRNPHRFDKRFSIAPYRVLKSGSGEEHDGPINAIRVGEIGTEEVLVAVDDNHLVHVWFTADLDRHPIVLQHRDSAWGIAIHGPSYLLAVSANSHTIMVWNLRSSYQSHGNFVSDRDGDPLGGVEKRELVGHEHNVPAIDFSSCGRYLLSCSIDCTLRIWNIKTGETLYSREVDGQWGWVARFIQPSLFKHIPSSTPDECNPFKRRREDVLQTLRQRLVPDTGPSVPDTTSNQQRDTASEASQEDFGDNSDSDVEPVRMDDTDYDSVLDVDEEPIEVERVATGDTCMVMDLPEDMALESPFPTNPFPENDTSPSVPQNELETTNGEDPDSESRLAMFLMDHTSNLSTLAEPLDSDPMDATTSLTGYPAPNLEDEGASEWSSILDENESFSSIPPLPPQITDSDSDTSQIVDESDDSASTDTESYYPFVYRPLSWWRQWRQRPMVPTPPHSIKLAGDLPRDLILCTSVDNLFLLHTETLNTLHMIQKVISRFDPRMDPVLNLYDRLCMVEWIEELSAAVVASQKGTAALIRLLRTHDKATSESKFMLAVEDVLPHHVPPNAPLLGMFVSKHPSPVDAALSFYRVHFLYADARMYGYELSVSSVINPVAINRVVV